MGPGMHSEMKPTLWARGFQRGCEYEAPGEWVNVVFVDHFRRGTSRSQQLNMEVFSLSPATSWELLIESGMLQEAIHSGRQDSGSSLVITCVQGPWRHEEGRGRGL